MHHTQRQRLVELRGLASAQPVIEQLEQLVDQQFFGIPHRAEEHLQQRLQALDPEQWCGRLLQVFASNFQMIKQGQQRPRQCRFQAGHFVVGLDAIQLGPLAGRVAQQHAAHAEAPGVLLQTRRQVQALALLRIETPAHAGTVDPALQDRYIRFLDTEARPQRRHIQQVENIADGKAAMRQFEQVFEGDQQWLAATLSLVGQGKGQITRIMTRHLAEHGLDMRRIRVDVRHHYNHITRA
ncbi:hypothetical protein D3C81_590340 [compost metagenome]